MVETPLSLDTCVSTVSDILKKEQCDPVKTIYVGCSMGGYAGFFILDQLKDSFAGACLIDVGQNVGPDCSLKAGVGLWFLDKISTGMSNSSLTKAMLGEAKKTKSTYYHWNDAIYGAGMYFQQGSNQVNVIHTVAPAEHIPKYPFPIFFVNGSEDYRDSEEKWLSLCRDQERSLLKVYQGADHFVSHDGRFEPNCSKTWIRLPKKLSSKQSEESKERASPFSMNQREQWARI